jgi:hypothetical protein
MRHLRISQNSRIRERKLRQDDDARTALRQQISLEFFDYTTTQAHTNTHTHTHTHVDHTLGSHCLGISIRCPLVMHVRVVLHAAQSARTVREPSCNVIGAPMGSDPRH